MARKESVLIHAADDRDDLDEGAATRTKFSHLAVRT